MSSNIRESLKGQDSVNAKGNSKTIPSVKVESNENTNTGNNPLNLKINSNNEEAVTRTILQSLPPEANVTAVRFEGPNIALYTKNPKFSLTELTFHLSSLSKIIKKRFIIRTDPAIRISEDETRNSIAKLLPKEVNVSAVFCDETTGEVVLEVNKPELIDGTMVIEIAQTTGWIAHTRRSPHIDSVSIKTIHSTLKSSTKERTQFIQELGQRIFRNAIDHTNEILKENDNSKDVYKFSDGQRNLSPTLQSKEVLIYCLGGVKQVGRSCFIVCTP
ncbi:MAG: hypothetical protein M3162_00145, partial [Thermoproteota archaeon]|nr:hypothetical protein [Thermoproteota archaeon]